MITVLHGENIEQSRNELHRLIQTLQHKEIRRLDGSGLTEDVLIQTVESSSLFGDDPVVIIENLFTKLGRKTKITDNVGKILEVNAKNREIYLWESKEISKAILSTLGTHVTIRQYDIPKLLFQFLDSLKPGSPSELLTLYNTVRESEAAELLFVMMANRIRQLIQILDHTAPSGLKEWQISRLTNQSKFFTMEKLLHMHKKLIAMESSIKTGSTPFTLDQHMELWLLEL